MDRTALEMNQRRPARPSLFRTGIGLLILAIWGIAAARAQDAISVNPPPTFSVHATHLLGFEGAKGNASGTLSIQDDSLQFQKDGQPPAQIKIASVQDVFLGEQSKQVGGTAMTVGKAAVPFGGGRLVSLFAHKNYDTVTLDYVDADGGAHGAIFQLQKGQGEVLEQQLAANGAHVTPQVAGTTKQEKTTGAANETK
jgi:hypothetical protein